MLKYLRDQTSHLASVSLICTVGEWDQLMAHVPPNADVPLLTESSSRLYVYFFLRGKPVCI